MSGYMRIEADILGCPQMQLGNIATSMIVRVTALFMRLLADSSWSRAPTRTYVAPPATFGPTADQRRCSAAIVLGHFRAALTEVDVAPDNVEKVMKLLECQRAAVLNY